MPNYLVILIMNGFVEQMASADDWEEALEKAFQLTQEWEIELSNDQLAKLSETGLLSVVKDNHDMNFQVQAMDEIE